MQVLHLVGALDFAQDQHAALELRAVEAGGLAEELGDRVHVVLHQHGRNRVVLGREIEQREHRVRPAERCLLSDVHVRELVEQRIHLELEVLEGERAREIELLLRVGVERIAVVVAVGDVDADRGERDVVGVGRRAHAEHEAAAADVVLDGERHRALELRHLVEAELGRHRLLHPILVLVPGEVVIGGVELAVLGGEVLVVEVEPVVLLEVPAQHLLVPELGVGDVGVLERQRHRVVPGRRVGRDVDGDPRGLLQHHRLHVVVGDLGPHRGLGGTAHGLEGDPAHVRLALGRGILGQQERAAAVVEQPLDLLALDQRPEREPIGLEVVGLLVVHRHQQAGLHGGGGQPEYQCQPHGDGPGLDDLGMGLLAPRGALGRGLAPGADRRGLGAAHARRGAGRHRGLAPAHHPHGDAQRHQRQHRHHREADHRAQSSERADTAHAASTSAAHAIPHIDPDHLASLRIASRAGSSAPRAAPRERSTPWDSAPDIPRTGPAPWRRP